MSTLLSPPGGVEALEGDGVVPRRRVLNAFGAYPKDALEGLKVPTTTPSTSTWKSSICPTHTLARWAALKVRT